MAQKTEIEIEELREAGEDGGDLLGYFARGHHDPDDFAHAANSYSGAHTFDDRRHVNPSRVRQVWWRTCQMSDEPKGTYEFRAATPGERGAWKATVCESVAAHSYKQWRIRNREYERGVNDGMNKALQWILWELQFGGVIVGADALDQRTQIVERLRASYSRAEAAIKEDTAA